MNQLDLKEMITLLRNEENSNLREELAKIIVESIENDISLKGKISEMVRVSL
jgi:hypothetical protein